LLGANEDWKSEQPEAAANSSPAILKDVSPDALNMAMASIETESGKIIASEL
jgi:hypothetical protein